ncbi:MAG: gluconokinase, GntK/IdnK-type [Rhizobacter sp.]|nr:gluconokinase, GntK/IdnK-type [Rhizobacter sp.]
MSHLVVMGVAGCGKSSVAQALAVALDLPMIEGDEFHSAASQAKMAAGVALDDADRAGWLGTLAAQLLALPAGAVLSCSALKRRYRDRLRAACPTLHFVHLVIDAPTALLRVAARADKHFFGPGLVASQFEALESPAGEAGVIEVDATRPIADLVETVVASLRRAGA